METEVAPLDKVDPGPTAQVPRHRESSEGTVSEPRTPNSAAEAQDELLLCADAATERAAQDLDLDRGQKVGCNEVQQTKCGSVSGSPLRRGKFNSPVPVESRLDDLKLDRKKWTVRGVRFEDSSADEEGGASNLMRIVMSEAPSEGLSSKNEGAVVPGEYQAPKRTYFVARVPRPLP